MSLLTKDETRNLLELDASQLHELLYRQHEADLAASRFILADGWMLTATEARLCALCVLV